MSTLLSLQVRGRIRLCSSIAPASLRIAKIYLCRGIDVNTRQRCCLHLCENTIIRKLFSARLKGPVTAIPPVCAELMMMKRDEKGYMTYWNDEGKIPVFSGIQPTGQIHIGNYLGAISTG